MTPDGEAVLGALRQAFEALATLEQTAPADVDAIVSVTIKHLRSWRPVAIAPLGVLPAPTDAIRDPRGLR